MTGPGWLALTSNATEFLSSVHLPADRQHLWQLIFATPWANAVLSGMPESRVEMPSGAILESRPERICLDALPQREADRSWEILGNWRVPLVHPDSLDAWGSRMTADMPDNVVGAVVTGEIASLAVRDGKTRGRSLLQTFGVCQRTLLVETPNESDTLLARGAALFGARLAAGIPAYFDTLPELLMLVRERYGEMQWIRLLMDKDKFAAGGKIWTRPQPVKGLAIEKRAEQLTFAVHHEEYSNIRELPVPLPSASKTDEPIELQVSITPAQGHARLEVIAERRDLFGHRRVVVDWNRMKTVPDQAGGNNRQEYIDRQPRAYPKVMRRLHSANKWRAARIIVDAFLSATDTGREFQDDQWRRLRDILRQPDQAQQQHLFQTLVSSASTSDLPAFLIDELNRIELGVALPLVGNGHIQASYRNVIRLACGSCLRTPEHAQILAGFFVKHFAGRGVNYRDWFQAMQAILRYRQEASRCFDPNDCEAIAADLLVQETW